MIKFTTPSFGDKRPTKPKPLFNVLRKNNRTATDTTEEQQQTSNNISQFMMDSTPQPVPLHPLANCSTAGTLQPPSSWDTLPISPNHDPYTPPPNSVTLVDKPIESTRSHHRHHHNHHHNRYNTARSTQRVDLQFLGDSQHEDAFAARQAALDKLCGKTPPATVVDFTTDVTTIPSPPLSPVQQQTQSQHFIPTRQLTTSHSRRYHKKQQQQPHSPLLPPPEKYSYSSSGNNSNSSSSIDRQQTIRRRPTRRAPHNVPAGYFPSPPSPSNNNHFYHYHNNHHNYQKQQVGCLAPQSSSPRYLHRQHTQKNKLQPCSRSYHNTPLTPPFIQENTIRRKPTVIKSHEEDDNLPLIHHTVVTPTNQHTTLSQSEYFTNTATTTTSNIRSHDDENHNVMLNATLRQSFVSEFTDSETDSISTDNMSEEEESDDNEDRVVSLTRHMRSIIVNENNNHNNSISARPSSPIMHQHQY
ncbi:hypothetical protein BDC45DRAFT_565661 [Circinella umbellata]|nr:hypothetical protein BDC45DRAFT_565661 [Circinella umbellata]